MKITPVLLAAGMGTRMHSRILKVLHPVCGMPMVRYALQAATAAGSEKPVVVVGKGAEALLIELGDEVRTVVQDPPHGTGHAVLQAEGLLKGASDLVLVTYADMPLLKGETLKKLVERQKQNTVPLSMLTLESKQARGFGRVVRDANGAVRAVVEEAVATPEQLTIRELNAGVYCFRGDWLWSALQRVPLSPKGEYYLTDTIGLAAEAGFKIEAVPCEDPQEVIGINTRLHLAEAEAVMRKRINDAHMLLGVTITDPERTYIQAGVSIGSDTAILPGSILEGKTTIGSDCLIGPESLIRDSSIADGCRVVKSVVEQARLDEEVDIGPYAHLRKGAHLCRGVHMGNFGEVKDSTLGPGTKMGHFSYIGDATIGSDVNIGAGTITCNYDGEKKNKTEIGDDVFIGSDTMLVAPVKLGKRARTGAGAVVTRDVPADTLVVGVPARAIRKGKKDA